jgi:choline dehydrogenase-like flavoprotein
VGKCDGSTFEIQADTFVVASGALETPRLLLNSNIKNENLGKYLMDHPMANLCQIKSKKQKKAQMYSAIKYVPSVAIKSGLELKDELQQELKLPNHTFYLRPSFTRGIDNKTEKIKLSLLTFRDGGTSLKDVWRVITNLNVIIQVLIYKFSLNPRAKYFDLWFVTEQIPSKESSVSLSSMKDKWGYRISQVNWKVSKLDIDFMKRWHKLVSERCFNLNEYEFSSDFNENEWNKDFTSAAHHVGTARMGASMKESVVDKDLKVFETNNLYVCDGSVFTTSGNANIGLTISALALRLAAHLEDKQ